jgi:hypothetical protein
MNSANFAITEFSEVRSLLARNFEKEKKTYGHSEFIGNSSPKGMLRRLASHLREDREVQSKCMCPRRC